MSTALDQIAELAAAEKAAAEADYTALVALLAEGKDADSELAVQVLRVSGRSIESLNADVERRVKRVAFAAALQDLPELERDERAGVAQLEELEADKKRAVAEHDAKIRAGTRHLNEVRRELTAVRSAREALIRSAAPELTARVDAISADIGQQESVVAMLRSRIKSVEAERAEQEAGYSPWAVIINEAAAAPRRGESAIEARAREDASKTFGAELAKARASGVPADELEAVANAGVMRNRTRLEAEYRAEWEGKVAALRARLVEAERLLDGLRAERRAAVEQLLVP